MFTNGGQLSGRTKFFVLSGDEFSVFFHKGFARRPEIELFGVVTEKFRCTRVQTNLPSVSMLILVTPSRAAGKYSSSSTPRALGSNFPPAALMRRTSSSGTLELRALRWVCPEEVVGSRE
jgi:hypothetical protein